MELTQLVVDIAELFFVAMGEVVLGLGATFVVASFLYGAILVSVFVFRNQ